MLIWMIGLSLFLLGAAVFSFNFWWPILWPILKLSQANGRRFWATVRENSAIGRRRAENTWMMYINLTQAMYEYILVVCDGYNPFVDLEKWQASDEYKKLHKLNSTSPSKESEEEPKVLEPQVPFTELDSFLKPIYKFVHGKAAIVWIGWPWFGFETVKEWYHTALIKEVARKLHKDDKGGEEYHTIPMKIQTFSFPLPITQKEELEGLQKQVDKARKGEGDPLAVSDIKRLLSLNSAETSDGFSIPCAVDIDVITVSPWEMVTGVEFILDQMYGLLNSSLYQAMASVQALDKDTLEQSKKDDRLALMEKISDALQLQTGMKGQDPKNPDKKLKYKTLLDDVENHNFVAVMARMGLAILRVRLVNIDVPKELALLLNQPAKERAQKVADLVKAEKGKEVAKIDAEAKEHKGTGERKFQEQLALGDKARLAAWDGQSPEVVAARLKEINADRWAEGVTTSGQGKVIITGGPNSSGGSSLEGAAAALGAVFQSTGPEKTEKQKDPAADQEKPKSEKRGKKDRKEKSQPAKGEDETPPADESRDESPKE